MAEIQDFSITDSANTGRWPENMQFSAVNNAGRADEGLLGRWYKDMDSSIVASGTANAYTGTSNRTIASYFNNLTIVFTANHTNDGTSTFNLNGLGAKTIKRFAGDNLASGDITSGQPVSLIYKSSPDVWYMMNAAAAIATGMTAIDFTENASPGTPPANAGRFYAAETALLTWPYWSDSVPTQRSFLLAATQAEMETATHSLAGATVALQKHHPAHPKAGINFNGQLVASNFDYGISSITHNAQGKNTFNFDTAFSSAASYWVNAWGRWPVDSTNAHLLVSGTLGGSKLTTSMLIQTVNSNAGGVNLDSAEVGLTWWGDL